MHLTIYRDEPNSERLAEQFQKEHVLARLRALDSRARRKGLKSLDPSKNPLIGIGMEIDRRRVKKNSYGVFNLSWQSEQNPDWADRILSELAEIRDGIRKTHRAPLQFLIWAGMGGSAEDKSMYNAAGLLKRGPRCYVVDSTDPAKLSNVLEDITKRSRLPLGAALRRTLVVGMAMGMTSYEPVVNLEKLAKLYDKYGIDSRPNFIYMTLPGSLLDQFASERGYCRVELQLDDANSTAGRHSGPLTRGSLYPLGLAGVDLKSWISATRLTDEQIHSAWRLAAFIHAQAEAGRDKVTLALPKAWAGAALWTKQDFEESLGKSEDIGVKIVIGERIRMQNYRPPKDAAQDRMFLFVQLKGSPNPDALKINLLRRSGYPTAAVTFPAGTPLSAYMQFIHYVIFGLGYLRDMNFVTQPSVELYKAITNRLFADAERSGGIQRSKEWTSFMESPRQGRWRGNVVLHYDRLALGDIDASGPAPAAYAAILGRLFSERAAEYGELTFFGDTRYSRRGKAMRAVLDRAAEKLFRNRLHAPVDVYEGPAMNHSYHEMIIGHGKCLSTVLLSETADELPEAGYTADYHRAQFLATQMALAERKRAVVAITVKDLGERSLNALDEFFQQTIRRLED